MNSTGLVRREARNHPRPDIPPAVLTLATNRQHTARTILSAWREGKSVHTLRALEYDLEGLAKFLTRALGLPQLLRVEQALDILFKQSSPSAHETILAWRNYLSSNCGLASNTVNRHLASVRSVSRLARMLGMITWQIEIPGVKPERRRDSRGPTVAEVRALLAATSGNSEAETRDAAVVNIFFCAGLRVSELVALDLADVNLELGHAWILGKGRRERQLHPLATPAVDALRRYLVFRGTQAGPLIQSRGNRGRARDRRLDSKSVGRALRVLGDKIGIRLHPHGLRHTSITVALDAAAKVGLGLEKVQAHSRHAAIGTLLIYADEHDREGTQRALADLVARTLTTDDGSAQ